MNDNEEDKNEFEISDEIKILVPGYLENRKKDLVALNEFLEQKDFVGIHRIAHRIKGTALGYGLIEIDRMAKELDEFSKNEDWDGMRKSIDWLERYLRN